MMGIRIQPNEILIPEDPKEDTFKNDLLNRKESIEVLTHLIGTIEGPCTMALNSPWGTGKTTFLNLWGQHLRNNGFAVVKFSAWENDFFDDPFVALCAELAAAQDTGVDTEKLIDAGKKLMRHIGENAVSQFISAMIPGAINVSELVKAGTKDIEMRLEKYQDAKSAIKDFKDTLQNIASPASTKKQQGPVIVMIDELDRCRPSYAVELLEIAKHIFSVDNIIFVLAINRSELAHSVKAIYGTGFGADGYLRRFFDVDFRLPEPDRVAFIDSLFNAIQINDYFNRTKDDNTKRLVDPAGTLFQEFSKAFELSLRQIEHAVHRLGLVFASLPDNRFSFFLAAMAALILRTINSQLYHDFINRRVSDLEVVDKVFDSHKGKILQQTHQGCLFEATLIMAHKELHSSDNDSPQTPLEDRYYKKQTEFAEEHNGEPAMPPTKEHWYKVLAMITSFKNDAIIHSSGNSGFMTSVKRLELMTGEMIDKVSEQTES